ncbi:MAG: bifunctional nicotinamidase/pyrazinamidase [Nitrososphaeria archaeon]
MEISNESALIIVDVQRDFCPGGALPVREGDQIVSTVNKYIEKFKKAGLLVVATRDWHPKDHVSFKTRGGIWPEHCVQDTLGAQFHPGLILPEDAVIISKADKPDKEAYSGFQGTDLDDVLKRKGVKVLYVGGLATDYCVKNTVLDGRRKGYRVYLLIDAVKGVDLTPGDSQKAIMEMISAGAEETTISDLE